MKVYISIPMSGKDLNAQRVKAELLAEAIKEEGHEPVNPFDTPFPPDELPDRERYAYFMGEDIKRLLLCDAIYLCDEWMYSKGCQAEYEFARTYGLKIL